MFGVLATCLVSVPGMAALKIGDPAPPLAIKKWIQGDPVDFNNGSNVYVLEFWAALSPASTTIIPKINEIQKTFKDRGVIVVGISDEPEDRLKKFVELSMTNPPTRTEYIIAADDKRATARRYMVAFGLNAIPYAFVVGTNGTILWHGHPLSAITNVLEEITTGKYDQKKAVEMDSERALLEDYRQLSRKGDPKAKELGRSLLLARTNNAKKLCDFAYRIATDVADTNRNFVLAEEALSISERLSPANSNSTPMLITRGLVMFETGRYTNGIALVKQAIEQSKDAGEKAYFDKYVRILEGRMEAEIEKKRSQRDDDVIGKKTPVSP